VTICVVEADRAIGETNEKPSRQDTQQEDVDCEAAQHVLQRPIHSERPLVQEDEAILMPRRHAAHREQ